MKLKKLKTKNDGRTGFTPTPMAKFLFGFFLRRQDGANIRRRLVIPRSIPRASPLVWGFTVIELLVATALFLIILAIVTGAFVNGLRAEQGTLRLLAANDNANFAVEQMSREIRVGTNFSMVGEGELHFKNSSGQNVIYRLNGSALEKEVGGAGFARLTATNVNVAYARFILRGEDPPPDMFQPMVTIALGIAATGKETEGVVTNIQTTVTPRLLDN